MIHPVVERRCLGWCGKKIRSFSPGNRYCVACRAIKDALDKELSKRAGVLYGRDIPQDFSIRPDS